MKKLNFAPTSKKLSENFPQPGIITGTKGGTEGATKAGTKAGTKAATKTGVHIRVRAPTYAC